MGREARRNQSAEKSAANGHQKPILLTDSLRRDRQRLSRSAGDAIFKALGFVRAPKGVIAFKETA